MQQKDFDNLLEKLPEVLGLLKRAGWSNISLTTPVFPDQKNSFVFIGEADKYASGVGINEEIKEKYGLSVFLMRPTSFSPLLGAKKIEDYKNILLKNAVIFDAFHKEELRRLFDEKLLTENKQKKRQSYQSSESESSPMSTTSTQRSDENLIFHKNKKTKLVVPCALHHEKDHKTKKEPSNLLKGSLKKTQ